MPAREAERPGPVLHGVADLTLELRAGRTRLTRVCTRPPLLVQQALYPDEGVPDMAYVFLANPTGGLLENDRQDISVSVGAGAKSHVTTQSATKVHPMTYGVAEQRVALTVAAGGYLEYLPDPLIPFQDASLAQCTDLTLEPGATVVYGDVITPGRVARGEAFQYRKISSRLTVYRRRKYPTYREGFDIAPSTAGRAGIGVMGSAGQPSPGYSEAPTLGSVLVLCETPEARAILDQARQSLESCRDAHAGASLLPDGQGIGVKVIGVDCSAVQAAMNTVWSVARSALLGAPPQHMRKY